MDRTGWSLSRGSGGVLVLLLIVRNFQLGTCDGITVKFAMLSVFAFGVYGCLFEAETALRSMVGSI